MWDVVIVGAGLSGLACATTLKQAGQENIVILDKSRGLGGRVATRRVENIPIDHGSPSIPQGSQQISDYQLYLDFLRSQDLIKPWPAAQIYQVKDNSEPRWDGSSHPAEEGYTATVGMTAIAKVLADGLEIRRSQRVMKIQRDLENRWQIQTELAEAPLQAKLLVLALPAPQALDLCLSLNDEQSAAAVEALQQVTFEPCLTVIAGYPAHDLPWSELRCKGNPFVQRVICDSHKRLTPDQTCLTVHSTPTFAAEHLEDASLLDAGQQILDHLGQRCLDWMAKPTFIQVHRWRYAIAKSGYPGQPLSAYSRSLWICGDWCTGPSLQDAFEAGVKAAQQIQQNLPYS